MWLSLKQMLSDRLGQLALRSSFRNVLIGAHPIERHMIERMENFFRRTYRWLIHESRLFLIYVFIIWCLSWYYTHFSFIDNERDDMSDNSFVAIVFVFTTSTPQVFKDKMPLLAVCLALFLRKNNIKRSYCYIRHDKAGAPQRRQL